MYGVPYQQVGYSATTTVSSLTTDREQPSLNIRFHHHSLTQGVRQKNRIDAEVAEIKTMEKKGYTIASLKAMAERGETLPDVVRGGWWGLPVDRGVHGLPPHAPIYRTAHALPRAAHALPTRCP